MSSRHTTGSHNTINSDATKNNRTYTGSKHNEIKESTFNGDVTINNARWIASESIRCKEGLLTSSLLVSLDEEDRLLSKLPYAYGAAFNSRLWDHEDQCLPETRVELLQQIIQWSNNPSTASIFWLNGIAGTGKSTIARTVARIWSDQKRLGASFFFSKGGGDLGRASKLFTTLAAQLANQLPDVKPYICQAIDQDRTLFEKGLHDQWKNLIFQPLSNCLKELSLLLEPFILVIDALDECDGDADIRLILRLLSEEKSLSAIRLRVFITSRPEIPIRFGFRAMSRAIHQDFILHNIEPSIIQHDISIFFHCKLESTRREYGLPEGWPGDDNIKGLCERARGLFIYASTACRWIGDPLWDPDQSLSLVLQDDYIGQSHSQALDKMYARILEYSIILGDDHKHNQKMLCDEFKRIAGSIVIMFDTLPATLLAGLLDLPEMTVHVRLRWLHSILDVPESKQSPVRLLHPCFRDFLLDSERCMDPRFRIDEKTAHADLFVSCLKLMLEHLKRDMCNLRLPGALIREVTDGEVEKYVPLHVQYACRYWVHHLERSYIKLSDNFQVHTFLQTHFLHWLEVLSLIGKMSDGVLMVRLLESILTVSSSIISWDCPTN